MPNKQDLSCTETIDASILDACCTYFETLHCHSNISEVLAKYNWEWISLGGNQAGGVKLLFFQNYFAKFKLGR